MSSLAAAALAALLVAAAVFTGARRGAGIGEFPAGSRRRRGEPSHAGAGVPSGGGHERAADGGRAGGRNEGRAGGPDPLEDDVAREVLSRLVSLLRSGIPRARAWGLLRRGCLAGAGPDGAEKASGPRRGTGSRAESVGRQRLLRAWAAALNVIGTVDAAGEDVTEADVAGPGRAWTDLVWVVGLSVATGAPLADLVERVGDDCAARADAARARTAGMAAARSTRRILLWLPVAGLGLAQLLGAEPLSVLVESPWGRLSAGTGVVFWAAASLWSQRIVAAGRP